MPERQSEYQSLDEHKVHIISYLLILEVRDLSHAHENLSVMFDDIQCWTCTNDNIN